MANETKPMTEAERKELYAHLNRVAKGVQDACEAALNAKLAETGIALTPKQRRITLHALEAVFKMAALNNPERAEFKQFDMEAVEWGRKTHIVRFVVEVGGKNDKGTMAEHFCRYRRQFYTTARGGLSSYDKTTVKGRAAMSYLGNCTKHH